MRKKEIIKVLNNKVYQRMVVDKVKAKLKRNIGRDVKKINLLFFPFLKAE